MTTKQMDLTQELLRARAHVLAVRAEHGADASTGSSRSSASAPVIVEANKRALQGRLRVRRDHRDLPQPLQRAAGEPDARDLPQHHRQRGGGARVRRGVGQGRAARCSTARYPITPATDILHQLVGLQVLRGEDVPGRGRDRGDRRRDRRELRRRAGDDRRPPDPGSRSRARRWASRSWSSCRSSSSTSSAPDRRRACRRRPSRPTCCRSCSGATRVAAADRRAGDAGRLLRHGLRGMAARAQVHDPGRLPLRRLPRQRRRAVAHPDGRRRCRRSRCPSRDGPEGRSTRTSAIPRRSRGRGPSRARRASSIGSAASRRPTSPATSATTRTTTIGCSDSAARRSPGSPNDIPELDVVRPGDRRPAHPRLGLHLRRDPERDGAPAGGGAARRPRAPPPPQPVPAQPRRGPRVAIGACSSRRSTWGSC